MCGTQGRRPPPDLAVLLRHAVAPCPIPASVGRGLAARSICSDEPAKPLKAFPQVRGTLPKAVKPVSRRGLGAAHRPAPRLQPADLRWVADALALLGWCGRG